MARFARRAGSARGGGCRGTRRQLLGAGVAVVIGLAIAACASRSGSLARAGAPRGSRAGSGGPHAASGRLTLIDGKSTTVTALAGRPLMVWFIADGCASCAASIPAVAAHLGAFARANVRVVVLGIYGAFGQGAQAREQLADFARSAAGPRFTDAVWTWGVASAALTSSYDPGGVPDEYFLLDRAGRIVYQGSVPVSTMGSLLNHLKDAAA